jgi:hypothetical protein
MWLDYFMQNLSVGFDSVMGGYSRRSFRYYTTSDVKRLTSQPAKAKNSIFPCHTCTKRRATIYCSNPCQSKPVFEKSDSEGFVEVLLRNDKRLVMLYVRLPSQTAQKTMARFLWIEWP